jgi:hypothetical protein
MTGQANRASPQILTRWLLILFLVGLCSRGYGFYNQTLKSDPGTWTSVLEGTADAPEQYRVGVVFAANWMTHLLPLRLSQAFGSLDLLGSIVAVLLLHSLLLRSRIYRHASLPLQWFGSAAFVALTFYLLDWSDWYRRVTTLPTAYLVVLMLWLWTPPAEGAAPRSRWVSALGFFFVVIAQAFVRADVALLVCIGVLLACVLPKCAQQLSLPRGPAALVSAVTAASVLAVQIYLMRVRYPHATYGGVPVFMLAHDYWRITDWASCLIFLAPFLWTLTQAIRQRWACEGADLAFLIAAAGYACLWVSLGRLDEVRIFLPFALALTPLTVQLLMHRIEQPPPLPLGP